MKPALMLPPAIYQQVLDLSDRVVREHGNGTPEAEAAWQSGLEALLGPGTMAVIKAAGVHGVELRRWKWLEGSEAAFVDLDALKVTH